MRDPRGVVMKSILVAAVAMLAVIGLSSSPSEAGCVRGAVIGGVAGHFVGHHGLLGAGVAVPSDITKPIGVTGSAVGVTVTIAPIAVAGTVTGDIPMATGRASIGATAIPAGSDDWTFREAPPFAGGPPLGPGFDSRDVHHHEALNEK
jgi:hypothetical protein